MLCADAWTDALVVDLGAAVALGSAALIRPLRSSRSKPAYLTTFRSSDDPNLDQDAAHQGGFVPAMVVAEPGATPGPVGLSPGAYGHSGAEGHLGV
jgi:hypothetical protein